MIILDWRKNEKPCAHPFESQRLIAIHHWFPEDEDLDRIPKTFVLRQCDKCLEPNVLTLFGTWDLAQLDSLSRKVSTRL